MNPNKKPSQPKDATSRPQATLKFPLCSKYGLKELDLQVFNYELEHTIGDIPICYLKDVEQALSKAEGDRKVLEGNLEACLDINKQLVAENKEMRRQIVETSARRVWR